MRGSAGAYHRGFVGSVSGIVLAGSACGVHAAAGLTMWMAGWFGY